MPTFLLPFFTPLNGLILLPLLVAFLLCLLPQKESGRLRTMHVARWFSLIASLGILALAVSLLLIFSPTAGQQMTTFVPWLPAFGIHWHVALDGVGLALILLTAFLTPLCILVSWLLKYNGVKPLRMKHFYACLLALEGLVIGVFSAQNLGLFYLFFEASLVPMFLLIGVWGSTNRVYAALKFFLYTFAGSIAMLGAIIYLFMTFGTLEWAALRAMDIPLETQKVLFWCFFAAFAVKIPLWPLHTWLPDAHVQAPTAGSVDLAGILLKLGTFGFLKITLPLLPDAAQLYAPIVLVLAVCAIIFTSLSAFVQTDFKRLIAYSSVAHMGFVVLGIFTFNATATTGAVLQMVNHGLVSAALFMCVGVLYDRTQTRDLRQLGGAAQTMPRYATFFMLFMLASVGLPATGNFVGEFMILAGSFPQAPLLTGLATSGVFLGATYMLLCYRQVCFGSVAKSVKHVTDLNLREILMFAPIVVLIFWIGLCPAPLISLVEPTVLDYLKDFPHAR